MKQLVLILVIFALATIPILSSAGLFEDLSELKKICDAGLLTDDVCRSRKKDILLEHDGDSKTWFCNYSGESDRPIEFRESGENRFSESASASSIVKEVLDEAGLAPNFIVRPANVPNAAASLRSGQRYVEYNPSFFSELKSESGTSWTVYSVMAHEIGHHLQGHTLQAGGSRPNSELEADDYSGFILAKLGASLTEAQKAMNMLGSVTTSGTHPAKNERLAAISDGWQRGKSSNSKIDPPPPPPPPTTIPPQPGRVYTDSCIVNGESVVITSDGAVLSKNRGFMQVGQKVAPTHPSCAFEMLNSVGSYCVTMSGSVHFGTPHSIGRCLPCYANVCDL